MRQSNYDVHALPVQFRHDFLRCVTGIAKLDIRAGLRSNLRFRSTETKESDLDASQLAHDVTLCATERLARACVNHIGRGPPKLRLLDSVLQDVWSKVELVVSKRSIIKTDRVPRLDHLCALVSDRFD